jgi:hypothetical protein
MKDGIARIVATLPEAPNPMEEIEWGFSRRAAETAEKSKIIGDGKILMIKISNKIGVRLNRLGGRPCGE